MAFDWQVQTAKARFSELLEKAQQEGPQCITRHGARRAMVLSARDYDALVARQPDFRAHLLGGPKLRRFSAPRSPDTGREIEL